MSDNLSHKKEKLTSKVSRVANSAMLFVVAYLIIMFFFYLTTGIMGKMFGLDAHVYYYGVKFELGRHKWTKLNIFFIWSFGTAFTFFFGLLCSYLYSYFKYKTVLANLAFLWGAVISFSIVVAQVLMPCLALDESSSYFYTNLSIISTWLSIPVVALYILAGLFLLFLVVVSIYVSGPFLSFSYSFSKVSKRARKRKYFFETVIIPYVLASAIILTFIYQTYQYDGFLFQNILYLGVVALSLGVSFVVINISDTKSEDVLRYKNLQQISAAIFMVMMLVMVFLSVAWQGFYLPF